jgi:uncharacterized metal-binding protein YceD (DUF177 family)
LATFLRPVFVDVYQAKFVLHMKELEESWEEVVFPIDNKSDTIDIEEMLYQAVKLQEPFVIMCPECL